MVKKIGEIVPKPKKLTKAELEKTLIDNFVNLQRVLTNLSIKFDSLSENISKLLQLFEISAKSFVTNQEDKGEENKDLLNKLDTLLEQNKIIAKGITLMEERLREQKQEIPIHDDRPRPKALPNY